ncbi:hypothetical protein ABZX39_15490 [Streptomyces collinus]|uniref:SLAC1 family transporter n=1 Tax=Streptomyces collinus TaxID=42684 RepID=UPI0033BC71BF
MVADAGATLPRQISGLRDAATVLWAATALLLVALAVGYLRQRTLRTHAGDPVLVHFLGTMPMTLLIVGAGTLLLGHRLIGARAPVDVDWVLWSAGTVLGLVTACTVPYLMVTRHRFAPDAAFGGWLLPVVPPLVSAVTGALLVPHAPAGGSAGHRGAERAARPLRTRGRGRGVAGGASGCGASRCSGWCSPRR